MTETIQPLNFDAAANFAFDAATPDAFDLSGFDAASGDTTLPAGPYVCQLEGGKMKTTNKGDPAFLLQFEVVLPPEHAGAKVWDSNLLTPSWCKTTKAKLAPLGLTTQAQLREGYSPTAPMFCKCIVTRKDTQDFGWQNYIQRFTVCPAPQIEAGVEQPADPSFVNPFAVPLPEVAK